MRGASRGVRQVGQDAAARGLCDAHRALGRSRVPRSPLLRAACRFRQATRGGPTAAKAAGTRADPRAWVRFAARAQRAALTVPAPKLYGSPALNAAAAGPAPRGASGLSRANGCGTSDVRAVASVERRQAMRHPHIRPSHGRRGLAILNHSRALRRSTAPHFLRAPHPPPPPCAATPAAARQPAFFTSLTLAKLMPSLRSRV